MIVGLGLMAACAPGPKVPRDPVAGPAAPAIHINYLGHSSFVLAFDNGLTLLTDYGQSNSYGLDSPICDLGNLQPTIVVYSHHHDDHDRGMAFPSAAVVDGKNLSLQGIEIKAIPVTEKAQGDNWGYLITYKGVTTSLPNPNSRQDLA